MRRSPLVAAILSGSFALQLLLAGGGSTCVDPAHGSLAGHSDPGQPAMAGMDMSMDMSMSVSEHGPDSDQAPSTDQAPCDQPTAPSSCQVLAACASGFFTSALADYDVSDHLPAQRVTRPALTLSSRTVPPELPPPRA